MLSWSGAGWCTGCIVREESNGRATAIVTTATYAVVGLMGSAAVPQPIRVLAKLLAIVAVLFWIAALPSFLHSQGWNF